MAVVSPEETAILMQMGYAEYIIPALNQDLADRKIAEFRQEGAPAGITPGQAGTFQDLGITFGVAAGEPGILDVLGEFRFEDVKLSNLLLPGPGRTILIATAVAIVVIMLLLTH
jgi:hypothetical protein